MMEKNARLRKREEEVNTGSLKKRYGYKSHTQGRGGRIVSCHLHVQTTQVIKGHSGLVSKEKREFRE